MNKTLTSPVISGAVTVLGATINGATGVGAVLDLKPTHADGYAQIQFFPEQGANQDVALVVHKCASASDCAGANLHRHFSLYTSPSLGGAPVARLNIDYGVSTAQIQLSQAKLDFDTSAAPGAGGGYVEQLVLANNKFVKSWNAANTVIPNVIGLNAGNQLEIGSTVQLTGILFFPGSSTGPTISTGGHILPDSTGRDLGSSSLQWDVFHSVILTASLPAAGASNNGLVIIEDAGAGNRNLIIYGGGERFRIDGGAAF